MSEWRSFGGTDELDRELAGYIAEQLTAEIACHGQASIAVSGGGTPKRMFAYLSQSELDWSRVFISLVDERWVEPTEKDSNERLVRRHLLKDKAAAATFVGMKNSAATATVGEKECERQLRKIPRPFDVLILGMGADGHTASLFPGAQKLARATDMAAIQTCMGIAPLTAPHERMTLTLPAIRHTRRIFLHITGQDKIDVLQRARADGPIEEMPIRYVLRQPTTPVAIYWAP